MSQTLGQLRVSWVAVVVMVLLVAGWARSGQADEPAQETANGVAPPPEPRRGWNAPLDGLLSLGGLIGMDRDVREYPFADPGDKLKLHPGFSASAAIGGSLTRWLRLEMEVGLHANTIDRVGRDDAVGYLANTPFLVNVVFTYNSPKSRWIPYVGFGGGGTTSVLRIESPTDSSIDDLYNDTTYACQAIGGIGYRLGSATALGVGYRYFHSGSVRFAKEGSDISRIRFGEGDSHGVSLVLIGWF